MCSLKSEMGRPLVVLCFDILQSLEFFTNFFIMKIKHLKSDYFSQLERPKKPRFKGRKHLFDSFDARYNNKWSINERLARYENRLQTKLAKQIRDKKYKHFYKSLDKIQVMKNSNIDALFIKSIEQVKKDFISTYFDGSSVDAICDLSVINSLDWQSLDFSTKESKRESFKNMLSKNAILDAKVIEREKALDTINKQASKKQAKENAVKVREQEKQLQEQEKQLQEQAKLLAQLQEQLKAMQEQAKSAKKAKSK